MAIHEPWDHDHDYDHGDDGHGEGADHDGHVDDDDDDDDVDDDDDDEDDDVDHDDDRDGRHDPPLYPDPTSWSPSLPQDNLVLLHYHGNNMTRMDDSGDQSVFACDNCFHLWRTEEEVDNPS